MNKERAAKSINVARFMDLAKSAIEKAPTVPITTTSCDHTPTPELDALCPASPTVVEEMPIEDKLQKVRHVIDTAIGLYSQDRHCELSDYWATVIGLLVRFGVVNEKSAGETQETPAYTPTPSAAVEATEEDAALAALSDAPLPEDVKSPPEPTTPATPSGSKKTRVITQEDIEERARLNKGRSRYLSPDEDWETFEATVTNPIAYLKRSVLYKESFQKAKEVNELINDVEINNANTNKGTEKDGAKWTPTSRIDSKGYGTYYRAIEGTPFHSLKVVGEVESNVLTTLAVLCELDMYKEWFPMCWESQEQGRVGDLHRWSTFTVSCPWPVASRQVFIGGFGCDCVYQKKIVIVAKSIDPEKDYVPIECNIPTPNSKCVTAILTCGGFVLEPLPGGRTKVSFVMNIDPKLKAVPTSLINWFSGKLIWVLLKNLGSACVKSEKKGSPYIARREEQKDLYEYFRQRALQVLPPDHL